MDEFLVSIVTPCYNAERFLRETIDSVINQIYSNWEMILVDDGSTDKTGEIIKEYSEKDSRIRYYFQKNSGSASARNNGLRHANGRCIALLDADDVWDKSFLSEQIRYMKEKQAICVCSLYSRIDQNSKEILNPIQCKEIITLKDMMVMNYVGCLTGLYDSEKYGKIMLHEELNSIRDDYAYWLDIARLDGRIYCNQKVLAKYRILANSTTGNKWKLIPKQYQFYRNYLKLGFFKSCINVVKWGVAGIKKFSGR